MSPDFFIVNQNIDNYLDHLEFVKNELEAYKNYGDPGRLIKKLAGQKIDAKVIDPLLKKEFQEIHEQHQVVSELKSCSVTSGKGTKRTRSIAKQKAADEASEKEPEIKVLVLEGDKPAAIQGTDIMFGDSPIVFE